MEKNRRSLKEFKGFPYPTGYVMEELGNRLIYDELNYDVEALQADFQRLFNSLTGELYYTINNQMNNYYFILISYFCL